MINFLRRTPTRGVWCAAGLAIAFAQPISCIPVGGQPPECRTDADCDDGLFCNGAETCVSGACVGGERPCVDTADCSLCDEDLDLCLPTCIADAECDDGLFCNGQERCECGLCIAGEPPCGPGDGCGDCDEVLDTCCIDPCTTNADCDDGLFCDGQETCDNGRCFSGIPPCGDCPCDDELDVCISACASDADCDDGLFCNGQETCGECGACFPGEPPCDACSEDTGCP